MNRMWRVAFMFSPILELKVVEVFKFHINVCQIYAANKVYKGAFNNYVTLGGGVLLPIFHDAALEAPKWKRGKA